MKLLDAAIGENDGNSRVTQFIDTGFAPLNEALSGRPDGGLPFGRMVEMFGESSSGKTALATEWMVQAQKMGGVAGFIDWERSFDVGLAEGFGLNSARPYWLYNKAETWESGNAWAGKACRAIRASKAIPDSAPILFVFDSIASAIPMSMLYDAKGVRREIDTFTMNDTSALSRVTSTTLKVMAQYCEEYNATFLYLNQIRLKIGVVFGDPRTTPGGKAMEYYATNRISLGREKIMLQSKGGKEFVGQNIKIEVTKSKLTKPFKKTELRMSFDEDGVARFDRDYSLVELMLEQKLLDSPSNGYVTWDGKRLSKRSMADLIGAETGLREKLVAMMFPENDDATA
ncbi:recombinase [Duganella sp. FT27W]|nr:recombinase [Duganella sp. FT27W]